VFLIFGTAFMTMQYVATTRTTGFLHRWPPRGKRAVWSRSRVQYRY